MNTINLGWFCVWLIIALFLWLAERNKRQELQSELEDAFDQIEDLSAHVTEEDRTPIRVDDKWRLVDSGDVFHIYDDEEGGTLLVFSKDAVTLNEALESINVKLCKCGKS